MTAQTAQALIVLTVMVGMFMAFVLAIKYSLDEVQSRIGRELTTLELFAIAICLPNSLLLLLFLPKKKKQR